LGPILGGSILVILGGLWALDLAGALNLKAAVVLPSVLIVIGLALIVGAADGPHSGLIVTGMFLSVAVIVLAATPLSSWTGGVGERRYRVTDQAALEPRYAVGVGELVLDLRDLALVDSASVAVSVGAGDLTVLLPPSVAVDIEATSGAGEVALLGEKAEGLAVSRSYRSEGFDTADLGLSLDLDVGAGSIEVTR
jgi:hypothetical protein